MLEQSYSYWNPSTPCATIAHPVGDGFGFAHGAYLPDSSGPTGPAVPNDPHARIFPLQAPTNATTISPRPIKADASPNP